MKKIAIASLCFSLLLTGCSNLDNWNQEENMGEIVEESIESTTETSSETIIESSQISETTSTEPVSSEEIKEEEKEGVLVSYYYYNQLESYEKDMYDKILNNLKSFNLETELKGISMDSFYKIHTAIVYDNPDVFWADSFTVSTLNDIPTKVKFNYEGEPEGDSMETHIRANRILENLPQGSRYEQYKYIYEYIINNTDYVAESKFNQDIRSVLIYGQSVCAGYAKTFQFLCDKAGLPCIYVSGIAKDGPHAWNMIELENGKCYWVDVTWGDPVYEGENNRSINYNYFCVDDSVLINSHTLDVGVTTNNAVLYNIWRYPDCEDNSYNYYRLKGCYFDTYDKAAIENYLGAKIKNNELSNIEMKFNNFDDFSAFIRDFMDGGENAYIFEVMKNNINSGWTNINYNYEYSENSFYAKITFGITY